MSNRILELPSTVFLVFAAQLGPTATDNKSGKHTDSRPNSKPVTSSKFLESRRTTTKESLSAATKMPLVMAWNDTIFSES